MTYSDADIQAGRERRKRLKTSRLILDGPGNWCRSCGHNRGIHGEAFGCDGVHVRGIANSSDAWDEPCKCSGFVPLPEES